MIKRSGKKSSKMLYLIGGLKIFKGILLLAFALAAFKLIGKNLSEEVRRLAEKFFFDPDNKYLLKALQKVSGLDQRKLSLLSAGTFIYAALFFAEGIGLLLQKTWGEYLTVIVTSSFLPFEIFELANKFSAVKTTVLILNVAIVIYLIWRLYHEKQNRKTCRT
ncbi:MAG: DUF2127 domain-containing protein [Verrucomicrobiota bacterium]